MLRSSGGQIMKKRKHQPDGSEEGLELMSIDGVSIDVSDAIKEIDGAIAEALSTLEDEDRRRCGC